MEKLKNMLNKACEQNSNLSMFCFMTEDERGCIVYRGNEENLVKCLTTLMMEHSDVYDMIIKSIYNIKFYNEKDSNS
jgi:hypothetical protein